MIDEKKFCAELEKRIKEAHENAQRIDDAETAESWAGKETAYREMLSLVCSMSSETSDDLEEEIGRYFKDNGDKWSYTDVARHFANWQRVTLMKKAESWLESVFKNLAGYYEGGALIDGFLKYMNTRS